MSRFIRILFSLAILCSVGCRRSTERNIFSTPAALGFKKGVFFPDSSMTLAQLIEESKRPNFVEKYLGKRITLTNLQPTGSSEMLDEHSDPGICGNFYRAGDNDDVGLTVWFNTVPKGTILSDDDTFYASPDSLAAAGILTLPFDVCSPEAVTSCGYPNYPKFKEYKCPFDFEKLVISGMITSIYPGNTLIEIHLVPTGLSD